MPRTITQTFEFETISTGDTRGTVRSIDNVSASVDGMGEQADRSARDVDELGGGLFNLRDAASVAAGSLASMGIQAAFSAVTGAVGDVLDINDAMNKFEAQTGLTGDVLDEMEGIAGRLFTQGFGDNFDDVVGSLSQVRNITGLTGDELERTTRSALIMSETFGTDITESVRAADTVAEQFGITSNEAMGLLFAGLQQTGDPAGDLLDTFNEYSANFQDLGLDAADMLSILNSGLENGARNTDDIADSVREFGIRIKDGTSATALWELGLDGIVSSFNQGETSGEDMFNAVLNGLREIEDPIERNRLGVELFGTKWEDMGEQAILALETSTDSIDQFEGTVGDAGRALQRGPQQALERFQRTAKLALATALGPLIERGFNALADALDALPKFFEGVSSLDELIERLFSGAVQVAPILDEKIVQPVLNFLRNINWSAVGSKLLDLYTQFLKLEFSIGQWLFANVIQPIINYVQNIDWRDVGSKLGALLDKLLAATADAAGKLNTLVVQPLIGQINGVDWGTAINGALDTIVEKILTGAKTLAAWATSLGTKLRIEINNIDWGAVAGVLDTIISALFTGATSLADTVGEKIIEPIKTALNNPTEIQNISTEAGKLTSQVLSGLAEGLGSVASWVNTNVIQAIITTLTGGGGGGREGGGIKGSARPLGQAILDGVADVVGALATAPTWFATNVILPFVQGLTGVDLTTVLAQGKRVAGEILAGIAEKFTDKQTVIDWLTTNVIQPIIDAIPDAITTLAESAKAIGDTISNGVIGGLKGIGQAILQLLKDEIGSIENLPIIPGVSAGDLLGVVDALGLRADGGPVKAGQPYIVGERGPELIIPSAPGTVVSNRDLTAMSSGSSTIMNGGGITIHNLTVVSNDPDDMLRKIEQRANRSNKTVLSPLRGTP